MFKKKQNSTEHWNKQRIQVKVW